MGNEPGTASEGIYKYKEEVYNFLANVFSWLSNHQGPALIIILGVLAILLYFFIRFKKHAKKIENQVAGQKIEIDKKDALIKEQQNKLAALQKKLSDQQGVVKEALLSALVSLTGYNLNQLPTFFKYLTELSGNPLQITEAQAITMPASEQSEAESDDAAEEDVESDAAAAEDVENDKNLPATVPEEAAETEQKAKEKIASDAVPEEAVEAEKSGKE